MNNEEMRELSASEMAQVAGGNIVNTNTDSNAGVWIKWEDIAANRASYSVPNGTTVTVVSAPRFHNTKNRNYVQVEFTLLGGVKKGWIAASIVGLPR